MYWPTAAAKSISIPSPLDHDEVIAIKPNRKGNFFAVLTQDGVGVWDVRPTVMQAAAVRTAKSIQRWGDNADVFWSFDGRGIIILTNTSHMLVYQLQPTSSASYAYPTASSSALGPGESGPLTGWTLVPLGVAFVMGGVTSLTSQSHTLVVGLKHPPSLLTVPWPVPEKLLTAPGSHFPPLPLDGDGEEQAECEHWELGTATWLRGSSNGGVKEEERWPEELSVHRVQGLPTMWVMRTNEGRVWAMYSPAQVAHLTPRSKPVTPSALPPHQAATFDLTTPVSTDRFLGWPIYPSPAPRRPSQADGVDGLGLVDAGSDDPTYSSDRLPEERRATALGVNPRFGLVAVALASGIVEVVATPSYPQPAKLSHTLLFKDAAGLRDDPGVVTSLAWTSDGYALAVGYERGWAVWSVSGRLGGWGASSEDEEIAADDTYMRGVKSLLWLPGNLELIVLPAIGASHLFSIPFAKSATTSQHSPDNTRYAFLQMDDRVLVYHGADQPDMSVINPESDVWQHVKVPNDYLIDNWPIRYASISLDGKLIAIAGRRGLTHYSATSGRWKLYADERQEQDFAVRGGLLWFHHVLVAAVEVGKSYEIRLHSRDNDLADQNILSSQSLPSPVLCMSLLDNSLLVYTADNTLYHFLILPTRESIRLHVCGSISFLGIVQVPSRVRALSWLIPEAQKRLGDPAEDLVVATIIFLVDGKLVLLRPRRVGTEEVRYDMQVLADRIESYWTHLHGVGTLENSLWGYDGSSMRVWLDAMTIEATRVDSAKNAYESVRESISLRLDFYPLSILMDKGIIIGVDHETSSLSLPFALFKISTGTHLFLPQFMRYHLSERHLRSALVFAQNYSSIVYFAHSLEILLHSILEADGDQRDLATVVQFLDHFPEALEVIVGCARKTELDRWEALFDIVGKPRDLFERCLENGQLRTAAGYLLVLHNMEEMDDAQDSVRLLRLAVAAKEFQLCKEILRFLHSIDETGLSLRLAIEATGITASPHLSSPPLSQNQPRPAISIPATPPAPPLVTPPPGPEPDGTDGNTATPTLRPFPSPFDISMNGNGSPGRVHSPARSDHSPSPSPVGRIRDGHRRVNSQFELESPRLFTSPPSPKTVEMRPSLGMVPSPDPVPTPSSDTQQADGDLPA